jgi:hypothetical protein
LRKTKRGDYSDASEMQHVRVIHRRDAEGWSSESPEVAWYGGADSFDEARSLAEDGIRLALAWEAEERGVPAPADVTIEHYVPEPTQRTS